MRFIDFLNESNRKTKQLRRLTITESEYTVQPKTKDELIQIIKDYCEENGWNSDLNFIDTSLITDMSWVFSNTEHGHGLDRFNGDISKWDVSNVEYMDAMFWDAKNFNQPLNNWDVSKVENMELMFYKAKNFNQPLNNWDVSNVKNMAGMFSGAEKFNQPLNNWDVSKVENMKSMFVNAFNFNQSIDKWDVSNVKNMEGMFHNAESFNQPLNNWDVSKVENMSFMFAGTDSFNQSLDNWDVSNVEDISWMFCEAKNFNQSLDNWDVSNVKDMACMFSCAKLERNGNLPDWCTKWYSSQYNESYEGVLENKFLGKKLTFIDQYSGEDLFVGLITAGEYGMYVTVIKSFDSHIKKGDDYGLNIESDYIRVVDDKEEIAIWSEDWDKKYHRSLDEGDISRSLDEDDIRYSILKRMKSMFYGVKTKIRINDFDTYFSVRFTVYDDYEAKAYGDIASWKKWLKEDLGIDPKSVKGSKTRSIGSGGGFDYEMRINK